MPAKYVPPTLRYLLAARQAELQDLETLVRTCDLVTCISQAIHYLQRERGYSNLYLCSDTAQALELLTQAHIDGQRHEQSLHTYFEQHISPTDTCRQWRPRLLDSIAHALYRLDRLPALRKHVLSRGLDVNASSSAYTQLIASLLAVATEATDYSHDAGITRTLAALLNLIQGKELSGQERACGVIGFTAGYFSEEQKAEMLRLAEQQDRCFAQFQYFADPAIVAEWGAVSALLNPVLSLRNMAARTSVQQTVDSSLAVLWFELCSARIDAMAPIAQLLAQTVSHQCQQRTQAVRHDLSNHQALLARIANFERDSSAAMLYEVRGRPMDVMPDDVVGGSMERSILELLQAQTERIHHYDQALAQARSALDARRNIERAKWILVELHNMREDQAHALLQRKAMQSGRSLSDIAGEVLSAAARHNVGDTAAD